MMVRRRRSFAALSFVLVGFVSACGSSSNAPCETCSAPMTSAGGAGGQAGGAGAAGAGGQTAGGAGAAGAGGQAAGGAGAAGAGGQAAGGAGAAGAGAAGAGGAGAAGAGGQAAGGAGAAGAGGQAAGGAGAAGTGGARVDAGAEASADGGWPPWCSGVLSGAAAKDLVAKGALLIDVRTASEYAAGHIAGAINIPVDDLPSRLGELDRGRPIVVYCGSGTRSARAAQTLCGASCPTYDMGPMSKWPT